LPTNGKYTGHDHQAKETPREHEENAIDNAAAIDHKECEKESPMLQQITD